MTPDDKTELKDAEALRAHLCGDSVAAGTDGETVDALRKGRDAAAIDRAWARIAAAPAGRRLSPSARWKGLVALAATLALGAGVAAWLASVDAPDGFPPATAQEVRAASEALTGAETTPAARLAALQSAAEPARRRIARRLTDG
ncbi:MAG: hypothetical protein ACI9MR_004663 [Myxococcota bacterium]|jgi:hypothetical protein